MTRQRAHADTKYRRATGQRANTQETRLTLTTQTRRGEQTEDYTHRPKTTKVKQEVRWLKSRHYDITDMTTEGTQSRGTRVGTEQRKGWKHKTETKHRIIIISTAQLKNPNITHNTDSHQNIWSSKCCVKRTQNHDITYCLHTQNKPTVRAGIVALKLKFKAFFTEVSQLCMVNFQHDKQHLVFLLKYKGGHNKRSQERLSFHITCLTLAKYFV